MTMRIVLADDHPVVRAGIRALLEGEPEFTVVGDAATPADAVRAAAELRPDVVLMDLQFGAVSAGAGAAGAGAPVNGADATREIRALADPPAVLVLTNYDTDGDILGAVEAGASGYLLKDAPPEELVAAIRAAAAGESALAPAIAGRLLARLRAPQESLSAREAEVLTLVAQGKSNTRIANELIISEATVKTHLAHIYTKLGVSSRTAAVAAARKSGAIR
ncbi:MULTISPECIES: response regulator transcription factor [unclassified Leucobacter]|uniref:LuxR C-terminal-related transcriptional regulator n=1 Tax=unclassified Leucobacter TaxID=2621730 RepID=UPI00255AC606|nr:MULTISPECIES: response regulator transcription factor [unclassified Leucobacter]